MEAKDYFFRLSYQQYKEGKSEEGNILTDRYIYIQKIL